MRHENVISTTLTDVPHSLFSDFGIEHIDDLRAVFVLARLLIDRKPFTRYSLAADLGTTVPKIDRAFRVAKAKGWLVQHPKEFFQDSTGRTIYSRMLWEIREPA